TERACARRRCQPPEHPHRRPNDEIDMEACNAGVDNRCPFTPGVGTSGVYFSFERGTTWTQPTYSGLTGRGCVGVVGDTDPPCTATTGPIGTLPKYASNGLVSDADSGLAFGPRPVNGAFSWSNGSRLYYANFNLQYQQQAGRDVQGCRGHWRL